MRGSRHTCAYSVYVYVYREIEMIHRALSTCKGKWNENKYALKRRKNNGSYCQLMVMVVVSVVHELKHNRYLNFCGFAKYPREVGWI